MHISITIHFGASEVIAGRIATALDGKKPGSMVPLKRRHGI